MSSRSRTRSGTAAASSSSSSSSSSVMSTTKPTRRRAAANSAFRRTTASSSKAAATATPKAAGGRKKTKREDAFLAEEEAEDEELVTAKKRLKSRVKTQVDHLRCAITRELMCDPVIAQDGNTYERSALLTWLASKSTSPLDPSCRLDASQLIVNRAVKQQVEELLYESGEVNASELEDWEERRTARDAEVAARADAKARARGELAELLKEEMNVPWPSDYMRRQQDINERMRRILVDWLVSVHRYFKLLPKTLFLAVALLDAYCERQTIARKDYQLVGSTAFMVASKCHDDALAVPTYQNIQHITDGAYTADQVAAYEAKMLRALRVHVQLRPASYTAKQLEKLRRPCAHDFVTLLLRVAGVSVDTSEADSPPPPPFSPFTPPPLPASGTCKATCRARYFTERCLQEHDMLPHKPSVLAAAAVYLSLSLDAPAGGCWTADLRRASGGCTAEQLAPVGEQIVRHLNTTTVTASSRTLDAVQSKYECRSQLRVGASNYTTSKPLVLTAL